MFLRGIIEAFYGRPWDWSVRHDLLSFGRAQKFNTYIYAPKSDIFLRSRWREPHPPEMQSELAEHRDAAYREEMLWGIGLSLSGLNDFGRDVADLRRRLQELNTLRPDIFCLLFDDMPVVAEWGRLQADLCAVAARYLPDNTRMIVCPSYYSFDPLLEKLFGSCPPSYYADLAAGLPRRCEVFWTGEQVVAEHYKIPHLRQVRKLFDRDIVLWDNYLANDGRESHKYLRLLPFRGRPATLVKYCSGHLANPMNQGMLSRMPLFTLGELHRQGREYKAHFAWENALTVYCSPALRSLLRRDTRLFLRRGLDMLEESKRRELHAEYTACPDPQAREIAAWLAGEDTPRFAAPDSMPNNAE